MMRTGIDILFDKAEARGEARVIEKAVIENAVKLVRSGMTITDVSDRLQFTEEQVEKLEIRLAKADDFA